MDPDWNAGWAGLAQGLGGVSWALVNGRAENSRPLLCEMVVGDV